jgi:hypothetical protein
MIDDLSFASQGFMELSETYMYRLSIAGLADNVAVIYHASINIEQGTLNCNTCQNNIFGQENVTFLL